MSTVTAPLNPEPADPKERSEQGLSPKSFADAVVEGDADTTNTSTSSGRFSSRASSTTAVDANEVKKEQSDEDKTYEKHVGHNGGPLTTVKPDETYEEALKHNGATAPREKKKPATMQKRQDPPRAPLESGRKAGAGWQNSAYV